MRCASLLLFCILECLMLPIIAPAILSSGEQISEVAKDIKVEGTPAKVGRKYRSEIGRIPSGPSFLADATGLEQRLNGYKPRTPVKILWSSFKTVASKLRKWVSRLLNRLGGRSAKTVSRKVKFAGRPPVSPPPVTAESEAEFHDAAEDFKDPKATKAKEDLKGEADVVTSSVEAVHATTPKDQGTILSSPIVQLIKGTVAQGWTKISDGVSGGWEWITNTNNRFSLASRVGSHVPWLQPKYKPLHGLTALSALPLADEPYEDAKAFIENANNLKYVKEFLDSYQNDKVIAEPISKFLHMLKITQAELDSEVVKSPEAILSQGVATTSKSDQIHTESSERFPDKLKSTEADSGSNVVKSLGLTSSEEVATNSKSEPIHAESPAHSLVESSKRFPDKLKSTEADSGSNVVKSLGPTSSEEVATNPKSEPIHAESPAHSLVESSKRFPDKLKSTEADSGSNVVKSLGPTSSEEVATNPKSEPIHAESSAGSSKAELSSSSESKEKPSTKRVITQEIPEETDLLTSIKNVYTEKVPPGHLTPVTQKFGQIASYEIQEADAEKIHVMAKLLYLLASADSEKALEELSSLGQGLAVAKGETGTTEGNASLTELNKLKVFVKTALSKLNEWIEKDLYHL
ncbi:hypothetical protein CROQUDRAFT_661205 [Cronartium quercuum f. sp. fusiforme G11]|uniref:Uncharacterized protein n=1 Tax=Cronartium quercuum f. sp. fusiforme G11 TaxID=708437 RepID=A0A9P6ND56_9BASI|nr:hypothetical protein CROQUDRAFT_661205 [Cronartium quercuum f. sp. fusiforme G11]